MSLVSIHTQTENASPEHTKTAADYVALGFDTIRLYGVNDDGSCKCWKGFACKRSTGKHPIENGWQNAPVDADACDAWLAQGGNLGIRMGLQRDGESIIAIDEDEPDAIAKAEARLGPLPETATAITGSGGRHMLFRCPSTRALPRNKVKILQGIDVRSQGGQITVAPSRHMSGRSYSWERLDVLADLPEAWLEALTSTKTTRTTTTPAAERPHEGDDALAGMLAPEYDTGGRHDIVRALGSWLAQRGGWSDARIEALVALLPSDQKEKRVEQAREAAQQARAYEAGASVPRPPGWEYLVSRYGEAVMHAAEALVPQPANVLQPVLDRIERERATLETHQSVSAIGAGTGGGTDWAANLTDWSVTAEPPIDWYCEALAIAPSDGKVTLIGGDPGSGKGPLADYLAVCFALGLNAFDDPRFACRKSIVGILDFEGARLTARRIRQFARGLGRVPAELTGRLYHRKTESVEATDIAGIAAWVKEHNIEVLVVDSYMSAMMAQDVNPNDQKFASFAGALGALGIVVIVVAHARKPDNGNQERRPALADIAGSFALAGLASTAISVWRPDKENTPTLRIGCMRAPDNAFGTFDIRWVRESDTVWRARVAGDATVAARAQQAEQAALTKKDQVLSDAGTKLLRYLESNRGFPFAARDLGGRTSVHHDLYDVALPALAEAGIITRHRVVKGGGTRTHDTYEALADNWCVRPVGVTFSDGVCQAFGPLLTPWTPDIARAANKNLDQC
jgi:putative DNA primase/helicase